jgi:hypothetical protein
LTKRYLKNTSYGLSIPPGVPLEHLLLPSNGISKGKAEARQKAKI